MEPGGDHREQNRPPAPACPGRRSPPPRGDVRAPRAGDRLPLRLHRVIGRQVVINVLRSALVDHRLVSIVGPGGVGKSTVALALAEEEIGRHGGVVQVLDLALCAGPEQLFAYVTGALDLPPAKPLDVAGLAAASGDRPMLLVLDNCEHMVDAVADLAATFLDGAPHLRLIATSREALRISGERVFRLPSLEVPSNETSSAAEALEFPSVALFFERAAAVVGDLVVEDADVPFVVEICRRLDGIPLAIELAAARVDLFGLRELAARLDDRFAILGEGRRTALPRHRTLLAALDWSYETLSPAAREALIRLSCFRGAFSLSSAIAVAGRDGLSASDLIASVADLAAKSMLVPLPDRGVMTYRFLETTRQYGWRKLVDAPFRRDVLRRHAMVCTDLLAGAAKDLLLMRREVWTHRYGGLVADVQAALDWTHSQDGDAAIALTLVAAAAPLGEQLFMKADYILQLEAAVHRLEAGEARIRPEMLRMSLPLAHMQLHLRGDLQNSRKTATSAALLQTEMGVRLPEVLAAQFGHALIEGRYAEALAIAGEIGELAAERDEPALAMLGHRVAALAHHFLGDFPEARRLARRVIDSPFEFLPFSVNSHRVSMRVVLARCAAVERADDEARGWVEEAIRQGRDDNVHSRCLALGLGAIPVAIWLGDEARRGPGTRRSPRSPSGTASASGTRWRTISPSEWTVRSENPGRRRLKRDRRRRSARPCSTCYRPSRRICSPPGPGSASNRVR
ncbi:ATP-binding protein [Methylobrevis pamukkalensis]|uniref:Putative HTH-type transcriptional regulator n=1 Tax=Methylobrevis pamukkalensis TaxID=1439726 RepID=A0A1E3H5E7_9HYPH|nr:hypothetical protein [Methylobrevis pamukkalensis]ODN71534.1 putative HTH-type transcriptional regulator [Methylobrevis pamukkalensis]